MEVVVEPPPVESPAHGEPVRPAGGGGGIRCACRHCGLPTESPAEVFCCSGCAYVYQLIQEAGYGAYYKIKDKVTIPADIALWPRRDYVWLETAQADAERIARDATPELRLDVQGISCAGCGWLIERIFNQQAGAGRIEINAGSGQVRLTWQSRIFIASDFAHTLQRFNYALSPASAARSAPLESRGLLKRMGVCAAFAMNVMLFTLPKYFGMEANFAFAPLFDALAMAFATLSLLAGGGYFMVKAARSLRLGTVAIDLPISLGIAGAYAGSFFGWLRQDEALVYFDFVSTFILLMLVGRWAQLAAVERNQRRLLAEQPVPARLRTWTGDGPEVELPVEALARGMRFAIAHGQPVPVESRLASSDASFSQAWINGEAEPRTYRSGQRVPAGAVYLGRTESFLTALQDWPESLLAELTRPAARKPYRNRFLERVIAGYSVSIIGLAVASGLAWSLATRDSLRSFSVVTAVLVVACPCAIGLAFPLTEEIATIALRKRGVFVREGDLWPRLSCIRKIVFDKTGTLTFETPQLRDKTSLAGLSENDRRVLGRLVEDNEHPTARALHEALIGSGGVTALAGEVVEVIGEGVALSVGGVEWRLGRPAWAQARRGFPDAATASTESGETIFARDGHPVAQFFLVEAVRGDVAEELRRLELRRLQIHVLSGDARPKVERLARELRLVEGSAQWEMSPRAKAEWLEVNGADDVLMLGDGANDSLAFDRALCRGTPAVHRGVLTSKADFYYLGRGIAGVRALFEVNDLRRRTQAVLLIFSVLYNLAAVGFAIAGKIYPLVAAVAMPLSSVTTLGIVWFGMRGVWAGGGIGNRR